MSSYWQIKKKLPSYKRHNFFYNISNIFQYSNFIFLDLLLGNNKFIWLKAYLLIDENAKFCSRQNWFILKNIYYQTLLHKFKNILSDSRFYWLSGFTFSSCIYQTWKSKTVCFFKHILDYKNFHLSFVIWQNIDKLFFSN